MSGKPSHPKATYLLLFINVFTYVYLAWQSADLVVINRVWMERYGFMVERFRDGNYLQIVTNMFAHFDLPHLGYNMVFLTFFGAKAEALFGGVKTIWFYIVLGVATTLTAFIYPLGTISAGASGAIFGLLGADLSAQRGIYPHGIWSSYLYGFVFFFLAAATGFLAHLVGLVIGFAVGYLATWDWYLEEEGEGEIGEIEV